MTTANLAEVCQLRSAWEPVRDFLRISHVRAHTGEPLNELADSSAKYAATFSHNKVLYRNWDFSLSRFASFRADPLTLAHWW